MSSSSVSTNGFLVPRWQLQRRSHRSMKGYVYYYFDVTSLACWLIHLSPSGKGSGHCRKGVLPVVDEHLPAKAYLTPYHTRYTRTFVLRVDIPTSSVSPQTASMINDSVKTISPNTYLGLSIVEQASLDKLGYELGYGCLDHIFEKLSRLCLVSPLMPYSTWHNQTLPYKLRPTSAAPISRCSTRGQPSAFCHNSTFHLNLHLRGGDYNSTLHLIFHLRCGMQNFVPVVCPCLRHFACWRKHGFGWVIVYIPLDF